MQGGGLKSGGYNVGGIKTGSRKNKTGSYSLKEKVGE